MFLKFCEFKLCVLNLNTFCKKYLFGFYLLQNKTLQVDTSPKAQYDKIYDTKSVWYDKTSQYDKVQQGKI